MEAFRDDLIGPCGRRLLERGARGIGEQKFGVECIGANVDVIKCAEQRELFKDAMIEIGLDGLNPLEVKAGMDPVQIVRDYGDDLLLHGGINAVLWDDAEAIEAEMRSPSGDPGCFSMEISSVPPDRLTNNVSRASSTSCWYSITSVGTTPLTLSNSSPRCRPAWAAGLPSSTSRRAVFAQNAPTRPSVTLESIGEATGASRHPV